MTTKNLFNRRQSLQLAAGAVAGLAITPQAIAQAPKGGPLRTINIGSAAGTFAFVAIEIIKQQGYFEKYGLAPNYVTVSDGSKIVSAVLSGEIDLVRAAGFGQTLTAIEKGGEMKIIAGAGLPIPQSLYTAKPEIKTLKDLEGRVVGTGAPGALLHHMITALLRKNNIDLTKIRFVNVGSSADVFRGVVAGTVDAGPSLVDAPEELAKFKVHSIANFWTDLPEYPYNAAFTANRTIAQKRDLLVRGLAAFGEFYAFIQGPDSRKVLVDAYLKATNGKGQESAEFQWAFLQKNKIYSLDIPEASVDYLQNLNLETGIQKVKVPFEKAVDMSMAREAMKIIGQT